MAVYAGVGAPLSAKNAKARIAGTILYQTKWNVAPEAALLDTTNAEEGGFENQITGVRKCMINVEGWWDGSANMYDAPLILVDGQVIAGLKLYVNDLAGPFWSFPYATLSSPPMTADVKDLIKYTLSFKAAGSWTYPVGNTGQTA